MKEDIGCNFKLEKFDGNIYHNSDLLLKSGRDALKFLIRKNEIKELYLPYMLCETINDSLIKEKVKVFQYHINDKMIPEIDYQKLNEDSYVYFVNYYGMLRDKINLILNKHKNLIIDNTHDFFNNNNYEADVIFNYRKYFGVPDGACIISNKSYSNDDLISTNCEEKLYEMLKREETGEFLHYSTFYEADKYYRNSDIQGMSLFTKNYLKGINYEKVKTTRIKNFRLLNEDLVSYNNFSFDTNKDISYMYPLCVENGENLRKYLYNHNIYSQKLWPNMDFNGSNNLELQLANNVVLLPIDQRYGINEMNYISNVVKTYYNKRKL